MQSRRLTDPSKIKERIGSKKLTAPRGRSEKQYQITIDEPARRTAFCIKLNGFVALPPRRLRTSCDKSIYGGAAAKSRGLGRQANDARRLLGSWLPASAFGRGFTVVENDLPIGLIAPASWVSRKCRADLPDDLSLEMQVFLIWLVLLIWWRLAFAVTMVGTITAATAGSQ